MKQRHLVHLFGNIEGRVGVFYVVGTFFMQQYWHQQHQSYYRSGGSYSSRHLCTWAGLISTCRLPVDSHLCNPVYARGLISPLGQSSQEEPMLQLLHFSCTAAKWGSYVIMGQELYISFVVHSYFNILDFVLNKYMHHLDYLRKSFKSKLVNSSQYSTYKQV